MSAASSPPRSPAGSTVLARALLSATTDYLRHYLPDYYIPLRLPGKIALVLFTAAPVDRLVAEWRLAGVRPCGSARAWVWRELFPASIWRALAT